MPTKLNHQNGVFRVCVNHSDHGRISGSIVGQRLTTPILFSGADGLLLRLERVLESQNFPQAFQRIRSFQPDVAVYPDSVLPEGGMTESEVAAAGGALATFLLSVLTRQNATWQGHVDWLDGTGSVPFSSDLEFLGLVEARFS